LAIAQFATGTRPLAPSSARPSIFPVMASVAAGACVARSVSSRAPIARAISAEAAVCSLIRVSRSIGSATVTPSMTRIHSTSGLLRTSAASSRTYTGTSADMSASDSSSLPFR
jgi:hypothetical protein